jgi:hypothetical protein
MFHIHVASVSCGSRKSRSGCRICCNGQASVPNVLTVSDGLPLFCLGAAYVSHICCKWFIQMLHIFHTNVASASSRCCIYFAMATHVFSSCFKHMLQVFQLLWAYVAIPLDVAKVDLVLHMK